MSRLVAAVVLTTLALELPAAASAQKPELTPVVPPPLKSERTALILSLAATLVPAIVAANIIDRPSDSAATSPAAAALTSLAILAGPALGHFYAGDTRRGLNGMAVRAGFAGAVLLAVTSDAAQSDDDLLFPFFVFVAGTGLVVASAAYDIATADDSARRTNARRLTVGLAPAWVSGRPGLAIVARVAR